MTQSSEVVVETLHSDDGTVTFRRSDGSIIAKLGSESGGDESSISAFSALLPYKFQDNSNPPPATGQVRSNGSTAQNATALFIHRLTSDGRDYKLIFMLAKTGDKMYTQDADNSDSHAFYVLTADALDQGAYVKFSVSFVEGSGISASGKDILFSLVH